MALGKYFKSAFLHRWNLLAFLGGTGFALLSGRFDVVFPVILAADLAYVALLGTRPKFQAYVDAQEAKLQRQAATKVPIDPQQMVQQLLRNMPDGSVRRFEGLRQRCAELRQLALRLRDPQGTRTDPGTLEELQLAGLDRLLWIYLRMLYTHFSLEQFLRRTDEAEIQADIHSLEAKLKPLPTDNANPQLERRRSVLQDNLETSKLRLDNLRKARNNYELVQLEIDSLESKIRSLSELAINRHEPEFISGQVDQVVQGMVKTEQTMSDLQFLTGLETTDDTVPELVRRPITQRM